MQKMKEIAPGRGSAVAKSLIEIAKKEKLVSTILEGRQGGSLSRAARGSPPDGDGHKVQGRCSGEGDARNAVKSHQVHIRPRGSAHCSAEMGLSPSREKRELFRTPRKNRGYGKKERSRLMMSVCREAVGSV